MIIHHISIVVRDLARSALFYETVLGLTPTPRPPFRSKGLWLACGMQQVHLNEKPLPPMAGPLSMDPTGPHFAIRVDHFDREIARLTALGYHPTDDTSDPMRLVLDRNGLAGFPQAFLLDPDGHLIEVNATGLDAA